MRAVGRWLTFVHPDPLGATLSNLLTALDSSESDERPLGDWGLFWDFASLTQKGGPSWVRTEEVWSNPLPSPFPHRCET